MTATARPRPGGRTARTAERVFEATMAELSTTPYEKICVEDIAARAGVHKTTVYRRWGTKPQLIAAALDAAAEVRVEVPDRGSVRADLAALARAVADVLSSQLGAASLRALLIGGASSPEIADIARRFWSTRADLVGVLVTRGIERGELPPGTDARETLAALVAPLYYRTLVTDEPLTDSVIECSVAAALAAAQAGAFVAPGSLR